MMASFLYPVALDLRGKLCVVVGGGAVGARRISGLREAGAQVTVIAPELRDEKLRELCATGSVLFIEAMFEPVHLDNAFLAVAATNQPAVNAEVARAARERNVLLNLAASANDTAESGDFATMASVRRGDLLLAVTTGGAGPALSARLRQELAAQFGPEWEAYVALLGEMREAAKARFPHEPEKSGAALRRLAAYDAIREKLANGDPDGARREALACLS